MRFLRQAERDPRSREADRDGQKDLFDVVRQSPRFINSF
jgi:hypothetical protein